MEVKNILIQRDLLKYQKNMISFEIINLEFYTHILLSIKHATL